MQFVATKLQLHHAHLLRSRRVLCQRLAVVHGLQCLEGALGPAQLLLQGGQGQPRLQVLWCHIHHLSVALGGQLHVAQCLQTLCRRQAIQSLCVLHGQSVFHHFG